MSGGWGREFCGGKGDQGPLAAQWLQGKLGRLGKDDGNVLRHHGDALEFFAITICLVEGKISSYVEEQHSW